MPVLKMKVKEKPVEGVVVDGDSAKPKWTQHKVDVDKIDHQHIKEVVCFIRGEVLGICYTLWSPVNPHKWVFAQGREVIAQYSPSAGLRR